MLGKSAITHSKVVQSSPNPKNIEERKNSLRQVIYQKMCNCRSFRENCMTHSHTHAHTHTHGANYNLPPSRVGDKNCKFNCIEVTIDLLIGKIVLQSSYYSVSYGTRALKICQDTEHQKVGEQHI